MGKKQFKAESKKLLDMMIHSIYTHKEIFLRELISNASDAIDKRHFRSLTDGAADNAQDYAIELSFDKDARTITIVDNSCGMTLEELEKNLGTIAKSGSGEFKKENSSIICKELLGLSLPANTPDTPVSEARTPQYYKKRPCAELVAMAAGILAEELEK